MNTPQRILFSESSPNLGGQELQLLQQMAALQAHGIATRLTCRPTSRIHQVATERGLTVVPVAFRNSLHPPSIATIVRLLHDWQPQAIISHSGHDANICALAARIAYLAGLAGHRPRLIRSRTYQPGPPSTWSYNHLSDLTLTPSAELRRTLLAHPRIRPERIRVLYPGIDFERLDHDAQQALPAPLTTWLDEHPGPLLVHAAMLRHEKGHAVMLDVLTRLRAEFPALRYVAAGEGALRAALEEQVQTRGLDEQVLFAGLVPNVAALYRRADVVVMPSLIEPLGMSQSEALALGVPVVASRTGGIPETVEHERTGLLVTPGDVAGWVTALRLALQQRDNMQAMAQAGRHQIRRQFSVATNLAQLLEHIASC